MDSFLLVWQEALHSPLLVLLAEICNELCFALLHLFPNPENIFGRPWWLIPGDCVRTAVADPKQKSFKVPIRVAFADQEKNHKSLDSGDGSRSDGGSRSGGSSKGGECSESALVFTWRCRIILSTYPINFVWGLILPKNWKKFPRMSQAKIWKPDFYPMTKKIKEVSIFQKLQSPGPIWPKDPPGPPRTHFTEVLTQLNVVYSFFPKYLFSNAHGNWCGIPK